MKISSYTAGTVAMTLSALKCVVVIDAFFAFFGCIHTAPWNPEVDVL